MTDEAYRAVFLRVHPTGKMVLSLTTDADGHEPQYAQLVADELGVPPLDVKVVPADTIITADNILQLTAIAYDGFGNSWEVTGSGPVPCA